MKKPGRPKGSTYENKRKRIVAENDARHKITTRYLHETKHYASRNLTKNKFFIGFSTKRSYRMNLMIALLSLLRLCAPELGQIV